jgi:hypothetical protein
MSEENVEIVRRVYVALSQGEEDTLREMAVPELVVDFSRRLVEPGVLRGRDEALAALGQVREPWDDWPVWEPQELIDAGDKVLAFHPHERSGEGQRNRGRGVCLESVDAPRREAGRAVLLR